MPPSRCSSSSRSRSERSSRSRSASLFLICHHFMSVPRGGGPHPSRHGLGHLLPLRFFDHKLLPALVRQPVILEFPISVGSGLPFGTHPSTSLKTMQRGIE